MRPCGKSRLTPLSIFSDPPMGQYAVCQTGEMGEQRMNQEGGNEGTLLWRADERLATERRPPQKTYERPS